MALAHDVLLNFDLTYYRITISCAPGMKVDMRSGKHERHEADTKQTRRARNGFNLR